MTNGTCTFDGCYRPLLCLGLCRGHYSQQWLGKPLSPLRRRAKNGEPMAWLREAVMRETQECIVWPYSRKAGYGIVVIDGHNRSAHVIALDMIRPWHPPYGPLALHSCDNPPCVNPSHLSWGTYSENMRQMMERGRGRGQFSIKVGVSTQPVPQAE